MLGQLSAEQDELIAWKKPYLSFPFATWRGVSPLHRQEIAGLKAFGQEPQLVRSGHSILIPKERVRDSGTVAWKEKSQRDDMQLRPSP